MELGLPPGRDHGCAGGRDRTLDIGGLGGQASVLLDPIVSRIREVGLTASKTHTDDTPVPMLDPGRGKTATGRLWAYAIDDRGCGATTPSLVWYEFTTDRTGAHPQRQLANFTGYLQADGYAGYDKLYDTNRVTEVACWAHFRRKIFDIHATKPTPLNTDLLERIGQLYEIETEARSQQPDIRRRSRQDRTQAIDRRVASDTRRCPASPVAQVRDGQGDRIWAKTLGSADTFPRRWAPGDR